jgi:aspartyl-tRNA(Asn)/glutamyl-tRNA(Gln) amidotransferase subunit A
MRKLITEDFIKVFKNSTNKVDLIVTPTCYNDTIRYSEYLKQQEVFDEKDFFTACVNIAGVPAITLPVGLTQNYKLPIGIQFISSWKNENTLLNVANWFLKHNYFDIV